MNKAEFVAEVARKASITRAEAARAVDAVFNAESGAISQALYETGEFSITGFGTFTTQPPSADRVTIPAGTVTFDSDTGRIVVTFKHKRRRTYRLKRTASVDPRGNITSTDDADSGEAVVGIRELARKVWEDAADAEEFLTTSHGLLDGQTPLAASRTPKGAERVREILLALEYGLPV